MRRPRSEIAVSMIAANVRTGGLWPPPPPLPPGAAQIYKNGRILAESFSSQSMSCSAMDLASFWAAG